MPWDPVQDYRFMWPDTPRSATLFDGITRRSPEGVNYNQPSEDSGWKQVVSDRDEGAWDWTRNKPIDP